MKEERGQTFVWISWLAKLLAGEIQCEFSCWFKAHFKFDKLPSDFNLVRWTMDHNALIHKTRDELERQGYKVYIEDQNAFKVELADACISAKPDIVAIKPDEKLAIDCKTGRPKNSDQVQVMLYMKYLPTSHPLLTSEELRKLPWEGKVVYKKTSIPVPSVALTKSFVAYTEKSIAKLSDNIIKARKVPSENECRRCDIGEEDCPERLESDGRQY